jgi:hypothetical protein
VSVSELGDSELPRRSARFPVVCTRGFVETMEEPGKGTVRGPHGAVMWQLFSGGILKYHLERPRKKDRCMCKLKDGEKAAAVVLSKVQRAGQDLPHLAADTESSPHTAGATARDDAVGVDVPGDGPPRKQARPETQAGTGMERQPQPGRMQASKAVRRRCFPSSRMYSRSMTAALGSMQARPTFTRRPSGR